VQKRKINITISPIILPVSPIFPSISYLITILFLQLFQKEMNMQEHRTVSSRVILGMILIVVGLMYLSKSFNHPINIQIFSLPVILVVIGIIILLNSRNKLLGAVLVIAGLLIHFLDPFKVGPLLMILWGIYIILKHLGGRPRIFENSHPDSNPDEKKDQPSDNNFGKRHFFDSSIRKDYLDDISVFGGGHKVIHSDSFKGGNITAIFGGSEIDLTQCKLAPGENYIDVVIIFGGSTIVVPNNWDVILNVTPLFGGFSNKKSRYVSSGTEPAGTLIIKGVVLFGGGEIKSY
jgi:predicted membrane protein